MRLTKLREQSSPRVAESGGHDSFPATVPQKAPASPLLGETPQTAVEILSHAGPREAARVSSEPQRCRGADSYALTGIFYLGP